MGMKRRYLAVLMGVMVAATSVPAVAYAESTQTETAQENTDADSTAEDAKAGDAKEAQDQDEDVTPQPLPCSPQIWAADRAALVETDRKRLDRVAREDKRRVLTVILLQMNIQKIQQYQMRH